MDQYLYGRRTTVESDHRALEAIMKKPLSSAPKRLQSMILELQRYRYDLNVVHKPGKEIPVTDCLSRNLIKDAKPIPDEFSTKPDVAVHQLIGTLPLSDPRLAEIRTKTATDQNQSAGATQHTCAWHYVTCTAINVEAPAIIHPVHQQTVTTLHHSPECHREYAGTQTDRTKGIL